MISKNIFDIKMSIPFLDIKKSIFWYQEIDFYIKKWIFDIKKWDWFLDTKNRGFVLYQEKKLYQKLICDIKKYRIISKTAPHMV